MRSRSPSLNRSRDLPSDHEQHQKSDNTTDHSVVTNRGAPARHSRRQRSEYRSWTRASDQPTTGTTGSKYRSTSKH
ncbi:uncharacterized protein N7515_001684 [Penicillium bovifimosum]|uniref:Uncharacterized protein n=1 Tax=Penicillium bovifimosum TaxID=126998 RepID=A0A9W9HA52_9EURO|nr:uncharacterized protein N7515_001684 [Penicillium bovifimosum]KAJ5142897.1 hypothetical protein N7515_001684 [Penicillium bovifimosum]